jgi:hypothetical protein
MEVQPESSGVTIALSARKGTHIRASNFSGLADAAQG